MYPKGKQVNIPALITSYVKNNQSGNAFSEPHDTIGSCQESYLFSLWNCGYL